MLKLGLTGGIGAGKSAVSTRLAALGAVIIDSDVLAREAVAAGTEGLAEVVAAFGDGVLGPDGSLDRPALGARVFGDDEARHRLEKIIHPRVRARATELAAAAPGDAIVVHDVPLLVETGQASSYHLVLVVTASEATRVRRLAETRGMTADQARSRIAAQATDETRAAAADVLIPNDGTLDDLGSQLSRLWQDRLVPFEENLRLHRAAAAPEIRVVPPDPTWPAQADRLLARIRRASSAEVHHIGSTSVPGLPAKDVIDLMLAVDSLDEADALAAALASVGFPRQPGEWWDNARGLPGQTWAKRFHNSADPGRPVNLHVRVTGSAGWRFALLMRDHLRADSPAREEYAALKARLGPSASYADDKEPWFDQEAVAAEAWAVATGWKLPRPA